MSRLLVLKATGSVNVVSTDGERMGVEWNVEEASDGSGDDGMNVVSGDDGMTVDSGDDGRMTVVSGDDGMMVVSGDAWEMVRSVSRDLRVDIEVSSVLASRSALLHLHRWIKNPTPHNKNIGSL